MSHNSADAARAADGDAVFNSRGDRRVASPHGLAVLNGWLDRQERQALAYLTERMSVDASWVSSGSSSSIPTGRRLAVRGIGWDGTSFVRLPPS
jgi:hypothetical protein